MWYNFFGDKMLIDSHCHVINLEYENPEEVLEEAFKSGVKKIIINGYDIKSSIQAVELSKKYKNVYCAVGISPLNIQNYSNEAFKIIFNLAQDEKVKAIGEIGLDYYWTKDNKKMQQKIFKDMLKIATKVNKPVIVHCREAIFDTTNILKEYNVNGIMHCYSGSLESAKKLIDLGFLIGISGVVTFKNAKEIINVIKNISLSNISIETDSPYLSPEPYRGKQNKPSNIMCVAIKIAQIKQMNVKDVIEQTGRNVCTKFDL